LEDSFAQPAGGFRAEHDPGCAPPVEDMPRTASERAQFGL
jgi:hypothetical protein